MQKLPGTVVGGVFEFVSLSERRRLIVIVVVSVLFVALFELIANLGVLIVFLAAGLAAFLYTRATAQETLAAGAYGSGSLMISLFLLELYWNWSQGSTASLVDVATEGRWRAVTGTVLVGLGLWLRQREF